MLAGLMLARAGVETLVLEKHRSSGGRIERDPALMLDLLLTALER